VPHNFWYLRAWLGLGGPPPCFHPGSMTSVLFSARVFDAMRILRRCMPKTDPSPPPSYTASFRSETPHQVTVVALRGVHFRLTLFLQPICSRNCFLPFFPDVFSFFEWSLVPLCFTDGVDLFGAFLTRMAHIRSPPPTLPTIYAAECKCVCLLAA